ncbi:MAG: maltose alpha-D-glucosyltransferase, partial [Actinomycetota bacterium]|nr:maltose alpha-D-glucosyltransferase [Actinomycetota bacterium]
GGELADTVRRDLVEHVAGAPYNLIFTTNGIACTTATVIAATLGIEDLSTLTDADVDRIRRAHLLLVMFNAFQPGVFALSGWDLCGMLTLPADEVEDLLSSGDTRWIHRAAHDLMGVNPAAAQSASGMPRGRSLYGTLPEQLADETSFVRQMQAILAVRKHSGVATARQVDIPDVSHHAMLVMVHTVKERFVVTVLNFADEDVDGTVRSAHLPPGSTVTDLFSDEYVTTVDELHSFRVELWPFRATAFVVDPAVPEDDAPQP